MWLFNRYGGHPLITRIACSVLNSLIREQRESRPYALTVAFLESCADYIDSSVLYYAEHVVSSLKVSFQNEYQLLVLLALGRRADFHDQARNLTNIRHLREYGIVEKNDDETYRITIDIIGKYLIADPSLNIDSALQRWTVPSKKRSNWVRERCYRILKDFRIYDKLRQSSGKMLFGPNTLPEAEVFAELLLYLMNGNGGIY